MGGGDKILLSLFNLGLARKMAEASGVSPGALLGICNPLLDISINNAETELFKKCVSSLPFTGSVSVVLQTSA